MTEYIWRKIYFIGLICVSAFLLCSCSKLGMVETTDSFFAMDTVMTIEATGKNSRKAVDEIKAMIMHIEALLSNKDENSELSLLNKNKSITTNSELLELTKIAIEYGEATNGTLDITTYEASKKWGFLDQSYKVLEAEELTSLAKGIDYRNIEINGNTIKLKNQASIWFGAIAKGYCSSKAVDILKKHDVGSALINLGGNVVCIGQPLDTHKWNIGIEDPFNAGSALAVIRLNDKAVVSSGNYQRFFEENGVRYHHILNPKTAAPVKTDVNMMTVICDDATRADCLSTALYVMGEAEAISFWRRSNKDFSLILTKDNKMIASADLKDSLESLTDIKIDFIE